VEGDWKGSKERISRPNKLDIVVLEKIRGDGRKRECDGNGKVV
jgi:hypothetical protein